MSWPTSLAGLRRDLHGRRGANDASPRETEHHASVDEDSIREPAPSADRTGPSGVHGSQHRCHHSGIEITDIQVRLVDNDRLRAWATITFNGAFVIKGIRIILGNQRLFVAMPSKQQKDGKYQDIAHPINPDFRKFLEESILEVYRIIEAEDGGHPVSSSAEDLGDF